MKINTFIKTVILIISCFFYWGCTNHNKSLASSYWRYTDEDLSYEIFFKPNGHLYSYHPNDSSPENDYWKQRGKKITLRMNDNYAVYKGKLIQDSIMIGNGSSKGYKWKWSAKFVTKN